MRRLQCAIFSRLALGKAFRLFGSNAEATSAPASAVLDALLVGAEASIRIGMVLGRPHCDRGFHQTATAGAFGATVAAARVIGLTREEARQALSLVATRASGLKSQFGSMGKPFNAGIAASNGVEAAELAKRGFVSCDDGVGGSQGFVDAQLRRCPRTASSPVQSRRRDRPRSAAS